MSVYRLSRRAEDDLFGIFLHGLEIFGPRQSAFYRDELEKCFGLLAANPGMGRPCPVIGEDVRRHEHASHVVFYKQTSDGALILSVLHGRAVPKRLDAQD